MIRKTKIVATIGPASSSEETLTKLAKDGLNVARLNFSHGSLPDHLKVIETIKSVRNNLNLPIAIMLDTKGPEIRTGSFATPINLKEGQKFTLTNRSILGDQNGCSISYAGLPSDISLGDLVLIDDGLIALEVLSVSKTDIETIVKNGGEIKSHKGVNVPSVALKLPAVTEKDIEDIVFGIKNEVDYIAMSFVRSAEDILEIRKILEENGSPKIDIIAKIENEQGVKNIEEILEVSDGIMVARGDLGVEIPAEQVPIVQKKLIEICNREGKPVITATQMLDSMTRNPRPTRAETTDVANAIFDGTDAVMLSGETAAGKYPIEALNTMSNIAIAAEKVLNYREILNKKLEIPDSKDVTTAVSHATARAALEMQAKAIITATSSGFTAKKMARLRPKSPIVACTTKYSVCRNLALYWGVFPIKIKETSSTDEIFSFSIDAAKEYDFVSEGDLVVISAGVPVGLSGATNIMKIQLIDELLIKGIGLVKSVVHGVACVGSSAEEIKTKFLSGDILVAKSTDKDLVDYIKRASALVVEEAGYTSHAAISALNLKIPCVVAATDATSIIKDGMPLTVNSARGIVFSGKARIK